jgi:hypothetical protein
LQFGIYDPADPIVLTVALEDRDAAWSLWQDPRGESYFTLLAFWRRALVFSSDRDFPFEKQPWLATGLNRDQMLNHGPPSYHQT